MESVTCSLIFPPFIVFHYLSTFCFQAIIYEWLISPQNYNTISLHQSHHQTDSCVRQSVQKNALSCCDTDICEFVGSIWEDPAGG